MASCNPVARNPIFLLICTSNVFGFLAVYIPYVYLPIVMENRGISLESASFVVSSTGIANTLGRVAVGWLVDRPSVSSLVVTNLSLAASGFSTIGFALCQDFNSFLGSALIFGLSLSAYISLTSIVIVDLLGLEALTSAFGLVAMARGVSSIVGPPMAGFLCELVDDSNTAFYLAGLLFLLAAILSQVAHILHKRRTAAN